MDYYDVTGGIAQPSGEGIADIYTALRLHDSCIGRGFYKAQKCSACLTCTGVRDIDYKKKSTGNPSTVSWASANCGGAVHCLGYVYSEAVWSLYARELKSFYGYDDNTSLEIVTRLTFIGAGNVGTWFTMTAPFGGCGANSGYLSYLAADDDDGDLTNGTPHMKAIYKAFNDQQIACNTVRSHLFILPLILARLLTIRLWRFDHSLLFKIRDVQGNQPWLPLLQFLMET